MNTLDQTQIKAHVQQQLDQNTKVVEVSYKQEAVTEPEIIRKCHNLSRFVGTFLLESGYRYGSEMTISHDKKNFASFFGKDIYDGGCDLKFYLIKNKNET